MDAKPCRAFVTRPEDVWISTGRAKKARKANDMPSNSNSGRWSVDSANEFALQNLLGYVAHPRTCSHGGLLNNLKCLRFVHAALGHQYFLRALDDLASFDLVVGTRRVVGHEWFTRRRVHNRGQLRQYLAA